MATFLEKKIHPSNLVKDILEKHVKELLWNSHKTEPTGSEGIVKAVKPVWGAE